MLEHVRLDLTLFARSQAGRSIVKQAAAASREICGVIVDLAKPRAVQLPNHSKDPDLFAMGDEFEPYRQSDSVIAIYHSHVNAGVGAELSDRDIFNSIELGIPYLSFHRLYRQWDYFDPYGLHPFPAEISKGLKPNSLDYYKNWRFVYGRSDCWRLVRSWFAGQYSIDLGDNPRKKLDILRSQFPPEAAAQKDLKPVPEWWTDHDVLQDGDILLMNILGGRENHAGVVVDAKQKLFLHTLGEDSLSTIEELDRGWVSRVQHVYRHKELVNVDP
jgi:proteasome lid subunit RPN8/RPN11